MAEVWRFAGAALLLLGLAKAQIQPTAYQVTAAVCCSPQGYVLGGSANPTSNQAGCVPCPPQGYNYPYSPAGGGYGQIAGGGAGQYVNPNSVFGQPTSGFQGGQSGGFAQSNPAAFGRSYSPQQSGQFGYGQYGYQQPQQSGFELTSSGFASGQQRGQAPSGEPGYLPNYVGDQYTNPQRIEETRALNAPFYQGIGGEPNYGTGANGGRGFGYSPYNQQPQYDTNRGYAAGSSYQTGSQQYPYGR